MIVYSSKQQQLSVKIFKPDNQTVRDVLLMSFFIRSQNFRGNKDHVSVAENVFDPAIRARFVRIYPRSWHIHISMRVEFYGTALRKYHHLASDSFSETAARIPTPFLV